MERLALNSRLNTATSRWRMCNSMINSRPSAGSKKPSMCLFSFSSLFAFFSFSLTCFPPLRPFHRDETTYGMSHAYVAQDYLNLGKMWKKQGDPVKATDYYQKALEVQIKVLSLFFSPLFHLSFKFLSDLILFFSFFLDYPVVRRKVTGSVRDLQRHCAAGL